jgi:hypothetical protein
MYQPSGLGTNRPGAGDTVLKEIQVLELTTKKPRALRESAGLLTKVE